LGVHGVEVVVGDGGVEGLDGVFENLTAECWLQWNVERQIQAG
jgi:hypothetical protein